MAVTPYCTTAEVESEITTSVLAQATDDVAGTTPNYALLEEKILESSADIDDYLRKRYTLPITDSDTLRTLRGFCLTLTIFKLYDRRLKTKMPEALVKSRESVMHELERIQSGRRTLSAQGAGENGKRPGFFRSNAARRCAVFPAERLQQY